jgi:hypothetical protein
MVHLEPIFTLRPGCCTRPKLIGFQPMSYYNNFHKSYSARARFASQRRTLSLLKLLLLLPTRTFRFYRRSRSPFAKPPSVI